MKVARIRGFHLRATLPGPIGNALIFFDRIDSLLVQLVSDDGVVGWGEAWASPAAVAAHIRTRLAPLVLGQDPSATGRLWRAMMGALHYDRRGVAVMAAAALDIALHDLTARAHGVPVTALLGGALRARVPAYASGPFFKPGGDPYRAYRDDVEGYQKRGFRAFKPHAGLDPRADGAMALALRCQIGPDGGLMMDYNQSYTARAAIRSAKCMEEADLLLLEEPVMPEDIAGYREVARHVLPALAGGEALGSLAAFREYLVAEAVDVLQPDVTICGGFTGCMRVAALAEAFDVPVMPHVWGTSVNFNAALQLAAVLPARRGGGPAVFPMIEYDATSSPLFVLAGTPPVDPDGMLAMPDAPGLGFDLTDEALRPWTIGQWEIAAN
jgi:D-galactarolactone cycloisomerase